jgi:hypothetical protein
MKTSFHLPPFPKWLKQYSIPHGGCQGSVFNFRKSDNEKFTGNNGDDGNDGRRLRAYPESRMPELVRGVFPQQVEASVDFPDGYLITIIPIITREFLPSVQNS